MIPSFHVLGLRIHAVRRGEVVPLVEDWIRRRERTYVVLAGAHIVVEASTDPSLAEINNASGLSTPDGMPLVWMGRRRGHRELERLSGAPDLMPMLFAAGIGQKWRHFLYGGDPGVADELARKLSATYPGIQIAGTYTPPFRPLRDEEIADVVKRIDSSRADIVWVGLGCPKQERWMAEMRPRLEAPVLVGVGAGFDFLSGRKPLAPVWVQRSGFEWLFRLVSEPRRLWPRYSRIVPRFVGAIVREEWRRLRAAP